jgi:hypothetical protein
MESQKDVKHGHGRLKISQLGGFSRAQEHAKMASERDPSVKDFHGPTSSGAESRPLVGVLNGAFLGFVISLIVALSRVSPLSPTSQVLRLSFLTPSLLLVAAYCYHGHIRIPVRAFDSYTYNRQVDERIFGCFFFNRKPQPAFESGVSQFANGQR